MTTTIKESTILTSPEDWEAWILVVKTLAGDSWRYINPSSTTAIALDEPEKPQPSDFGGTSSSNIDPNQRADWLEFNKLYHQELKEYERKKARIDKAEEYIITHTDKSLLLQRANYDSLRDFLISLKKALAPSDSTREQMIIDRYIQAKQLSARNTNFESWQQEYLLAYLRAKEAKIPDVSGDRAHWDLVKAIKQLDSGYAAIISTQITSNQASNQALNQASNQASLPSIEDTLSAFAQHYRRTYIKEPNIHGGTFVATLQDEESPYNKKRARQDDIPSKPCICGDMHFWRQCPYIDTALRQSGFVEDPAKVKKIAQFETKDEKGILNKIRDKNRRFKRTKKPQNEDLDRRSEPDSIEIDAGDTPTNQLPHEAHAVFSSAFNNIV